MKAILRITNVRLKFLGRYKINGVIISDVEIMYNNFEKVSVLLSEIQTKCGIQNVIDVIYV